MAKGLHIIDRRIHPFWICAVLAIAAIWVFHDVRTYDFVNLDDPDYIYQNPNIQNGITLEAVKWALTAGYAANWHPLTWLSYMLEWQFFGSSAGGYHLTNLILHIANTLLLFIVLKQMTKALWQSAFAAALFALHPLHVESVAWVSERKDVLSTFFWFLTMWAYVRYVNRPKISGYLPVIVFFALGLMAKPMLVTLPFVLLLLDYWPLDRLSPKHIKADKKYPLVYLLIEKIPLFAITIASCVITFICQNTAGAVPKGENYAFSIRLANASISYMQYIIKMILPVRLVVLYPHPGVNVSISSAVISAVILLIVTIIVLRFAKNHRYLVTGWFWYLGTLVPVIGLVQVGIQAMADRYSYITLTGLFIIIAWTVPDVLAKWRYKKIALSLSAILIISAMSVCTYFQLHYWQNSLTLYQHALDVTRNNYMAHFGIAGRLYKLGRLNEAIYHYLEAVRIRPGFTPTYVNLSAALYETGRVDEAIARLEDVLRLKPDLPGPMNNLAWYLAASEKTAAHNPDRAIRLAQKACELTNYENPAMLDTLAVAFASAGKFSQAIETAEKALGLCRTSQQKTIKNDIESRLVLYKAGKPYIETR